ncbi:hypothetical protein IFM89_028712 [Coptis chinensis]|uniref:Uncharacterized protein n=1 Tax=Coptis chinensis TaxID=261450 RepID=A0A835LES8_9MAGN|nr:hypothetical protein IFM89_028712 [Coptis chinensis]
MAKTSLVLFLVLSSFFIALLQCDARTHRSRTQPRPLRPQPEPQRCKYDGIFQFGDSISDTGNQILEPAGPRSPCAHNPYGQKLIGEPTGRCSNGRLMIDFIAQALGLPTPKPYLELGLPTPNPYLEPGEPAVSFNHGVNFAVAGSTALNTSVLLQNGILSPVTNSSLLVQLDWFLAHYQNLCETAKNCETYNILKGSLFMVGETGGNDYNYAFLQGKSIEDATALVPLVVNNIRDVAKKLIDLGATRLVVPGNFPIGCSPMYLTLFKNNDSTSYDDKGCLKGLNTFARYHNQYLQNALQQLRLEYPNVAIVYADYYQAAEWVLTNAPQLGFETKSILKVCCGTGGDYNFSLMSMCLGWKEFCMFRSDQYINWDGVHLTEKAYQSMADWLIKSQVFECIV